MQNALESYRIKGRSFGLDSNIVGAYNNNPILNALTYDVEFTDVKVREYDAKVIVEITIIGVYSNRYATMTLESMFNYKKCITSYGVDAKCVYYRNECRMRKTAKCWGFKVLQADSNMSIVPLKDLN